LFPQWACNFADILCTRGQIPRDTGPDQDPPYDPSWPKRPQYQQCIKKAGNKLDECKDMKRIYTIDQIAQCVQDVTDMIEDCHVLYGPGT